MAEAERGPGRGRGGPVVIGGIDGRGSGAGRRGGGDRSRMNYGFAFIFLMKISCLRTRSYSKELFVVVSSKLHLVDWLDRL